MDTQSLPIAREAKIVCHPQIRGGAPVVAGTRIPVWAIVLYSTGTTDRYEVLVHFPDLTKADVDAALAYYEAHQEEIDRYVAENVAVD